MKKLLIIALCATSLVMANSGEKECKTKADMMKGCVETKSWNGSYINKYWYKNGKVVRDTTTDERGRLKEERSTSIKRIGNLSIQIKKTVGYETTGEVKYKNEFHCVLNNKGECDTDNYLQWRSEGSYNKPNKNCIGISDPSSTQIYYAYNGVCNRELGYGEESCFKDGKEYIGCADKEKQELLNKDFSDFYKICFKQYSSNDIDFFPCSK